MNKLFSSQHIFFYNIFAFLTAVFTFILILHKFDETEYESTLTIFIMFLFVSSIAGVILVGSRAMHQKKEVKMFIKVLIVSIPAIYFTLLIGSFFLT